MLKTIKLTVLTTLLSVLCGSSLPAIGENDVINDGMDHAVKLNMRTVQIAAESFALDNNGRYPARLTDHFRCYFPAGDPVRKKVGQAPVNPFTKKAEWPVIGSIKIAEQARSAGPLPVSPGVIEYSSLADGTDYAIIGGGHDGKALPSR